MILSCNAIGCSDIISAASPNLAADKYSPSAAIILALFSFQLSL